MNLEDHCGDIIRKARMMAGVPTAIAAKAAGLSEKEYRVLERSGQSPIRPDFGALAKLTGLDGSKLEGIHNGWHPAARDLNRWRHLRAITTSDGEMGVNCFLIWDETTLEATLFDTGFDPVPVAEAIAKQRLRLRHVLITHGHSDHVACLDELQIAFPDVAVHNHGSTGVNRFESLKIGNLTIIRRETPGHADDGVTYLVQGWPDGVPPVAVVGDALFAGSMGRAHDGRLARMKVREHILSLDAETLICPGHGPLTTVGEEVAHNPFF